MFNNKSLYLFCYHHKDQGKEEDKKEEEEKELTEKLLSFFLHITKIHNTDASRTFTKICKFSQLYFPRVTQLKRI